MVREESALLEAPQALVSLQAAGVLRRFGYPAHHPTYGFGEATFPGKDLELLPTESRFRYRGLEVRVPYPGLGPALAALAALAVAELLGHDPKEVAARLASLRLPPGRMERQERGASCS